MSRPGEHLSSESSLKHVDMANSRDQKSEQKDICENNKKISESESHIPLSRISFFPLHSPIPRHLSGVFKIRLSRLRRDRSRL